MAAVRAHSSRRQRLLHSSSARHSRRNTGSVGATDSIKDEACMHPLSACALGRHCMLSQASHALGICIIVESWPSLFIVLRACFEEDGWLECANKVLWSSVLLLGPLLAVQLDTGFYCTGCSEYACLLAQGSSAPVLRMLTPGAADTHVGNRPSFLTATGLANSNVYKPLASRTATTTTTITITLTQHVQAVWAGQVSHVAATCLHQSQDSTGPHDLKSFESNLFKPTYSSQAWSVSPAQAGLGATTGTPHAAVSDIVTLLPAAWHTS